MKTWLSPKDSGFPANLSDDSSFYSYNLSLIEAGVGVGTFYCFSLLLSEQSLCPLPPNFLFLNSSTIIQYPSLLLFLTFLDLSDLVTDLQILPPFLFYTSLVFNYNFNISGRSFLHPKFFDP